MSHKPRQFDSPLAAGIRAFVAHKRSLGLRYDGQEKLFVLLDRYLVEQGITRPSDITPDVLDGFLASRPRAPRSHNILLAAVRKLFHWLVLHEYVVTSPVRSERKRCSAAVRPYLFNKTQVRSLLDAAARLPDNPRALMRGDIYEMIFALLYALGLRVGEVTRLRRSDIDFEHKFLVIRQSKFSKSRLVPFGPCVEAKLQRFLNHSECHLGVNKPEHAVFSFSRDRRCPVSTTTVSWIFHKLVLDLEIKAPPGIGSPHLHCLRHSFAVATLLRWYREGIDPSERLLYLSAFLGHVNPTSTAVYLTITDELLQAASKRFEQFAAPALEGVRS